MFYTATYDSDLTSDLFNKETVIDGTKVNLFSNPVIFCDARKTKISADKFYVISTGCCRSCHEKITPYSQKYYCLNPFTKSAREFSFSNSYCEKCAKENAALSRRGNDGDPNRTPATTVIKRRETSNGIDLTYYADGSIDGLPSCYTANDIQKIRGL